jgi:tyrosine-protein phosphatase YwqE
VTFLGSDAHSLETRPILIKGALEKIASLYGEDTKQKLIDNSEWLLSQIIKKELEV